MKKWKYIISSFMAVAMIVGLNVQNVLADEINQNQIFPDTQARIDSTLAEYPQFEKYINGVLDTVEISDFSDDANEINSFIMQALDTVGEIGAMGQSRYQTAVQEYENRIEPRVGIAYNTALAAYNQGIRIVENRGCRKTQLVILQVSMTQILHGHIHLFMIVMAFMMQCVRNLNLSFYQIIQVEELLGEHLNIHRRIVLLMLLLRFIE